MESSRLLNRGVEEIIVKEHLETALKSGKKLRVKFGIDPTAPDLHLGHMVVLRKLRQFQDAGHQAILVIGDFTAQIGDPSGRSEERKPLTTKEVKQNMKKYLKQAGKILNLRKAKVEYNSKWLSKKGTLMQIAKIGTINQMLQRADFKERVESGSNVSMAEALYPLLQGYDSAAIKADLEIGGYDQRFNLLAGRQVQKYLDQPEQDILTLPILEGTDGSKKMSKSADNYIAVDADPTDMFGKIMSVPDELIDKYYGLLTDEERSEQDPRNSKLHLAEIIVSDLHNEKAAINAKEGFINQFSKHEKPSDIQTISAGVSEIALVDLVMKANFASSKSEARRLIDQGAVKINDEKKTSATEIIKISGKVLLQVGPRHFLYLE